MHFIRLQVGNDGASEVEIDGVPRAALRPSAADRESPPSSIVTCVVSGAYSSPLAILSHLFYRSNTKILYLS